MTARKGSVTTVKWPSDNEAEKRFEALRARDHELIDSARNVAIPARVAELEEENLYFRILSKFRKVGKPGWLWVKVAGASVSIVRRLLKLA